MPSYAFGFPFAPLNGRTLVVVIVARISTEHQDERSLEDQTALVKQYVSDQHDGKIEWRVVKSRGSGEFLDRQELTELEGLIESGTVDAVVCEDLARICRRTRAYDLCELAVDNDVRLIAINDHVDTAKSDWQLNAFFSVFRHESYNRDTAARIRRTQRNRFQSGGMVKLPPFCYRKPAGCKLDSDFEKIAELESIVLGIFDRLESGWSFSRIADWLNENKVPIGPACRRKKWNGAMVRRFVINPVLKGLRVWNAKKSVRVNKTGRRKAVVAPSEDRLERQVPHLAFIDPERYDRLIAKLVKEGERYSIPKCRGNDPRKGRPRKRTRFPGQHVYCEQCKEMFVFGGHGQTDHLMCNGARTYTCWNGVTFDSRLAARRISDAVLSFLSELPDFDSAILTLLKDEAAQAQQSRHQQLRQVTKDLERTAREEERLVDAIKSGGELQSLVTSLKELQSNRKSLEYEQKQLEKDLPPPIQLPSADEIRKEVRRAFQELALDALDFGDFMRQIIPKIWVFPVQLCDGGFPVLRARFEVNLTSYLPEAYRLPSLEAQVRREFVVDLFEMPQRAAFRERVVALRAQGVTERQVAIQLGLTITAAQRAAGLHRLMQQFGLTDPYVPLLEPPSDSAKFRRHHHPRYRNRGDDGGDAA